MKMFDGVRNPAHEISNPNVLNQPLFAPGVYDYEAEKDVKFSNEDYKRMIIDEINILKGLPAKSKVTPPLNLNF